MAESKDTLLRRAERLRSERAKLTATWEVKLREVTALRRAYADKGVQLDACLEQLAAAVKAEGIANLTGQHEAVPPPTPSTPTGMRPPRCTCGAGMPLAGMPCPMHAHGGTTP